jgi:hypothetical protein
MAISKKLRQRARAIIDDAEGYDAETREAIRRSLESNDADLAELVRRAESSERILDVSAREEDREALKARAAEIIEDVRGFDGDTRRAVFVALSNLNFAETNPQPPTKYTDVRFCEGDLREAIRKAEQKLPAFDAEGMNADRLAEARTVYSIISGDELSVPDFIADAVRVALEEAARTVGPDIWLDVDGSGDPATGDYSVRSMAALFSKLGVGGPEVEPARDLAGHIAAVLNHPDTPSRIYHGLSEAVSELTAKDAVSNRADVIRAALEVSAAEDGEGGDE